MSKLLTNMLVTPNKPTLPPVLYVTRTHLRGYRDDYYCRYIGYKNAVDVAGYSVPATVGKYVLVEEFKAVRNDGVTITDSLVVAECR
jgi:hypothetical protein